MSLIQCEQCGDMHEPTADDATHACPEYDFGTILLIVNRTIRGRVGSSMPESFQLSVDKETGRFALTGHSNKIYEATYAVRAGDERNLDMYTLPARVAIKEALDDALTNGLAGGKI